MTLVSIPANPVPENTVAGMLKTKDGVGLRFARFAPPAGRKGTVCLFQGRAEFIEKYFETVRDLRSRGFAVATLDWRGQGGSQRALSDPYKGHVRDFAEYELDVEAFMREIVLPDCPPPHYAMAHSMGASVLLRLAYKGQRWFDRMVMSAPMIGLSTKTYPRFAKPVMKTMRMFGMGSSYIPGGDATVMAAQRFIGNPVTPIRCGMPARSRSWRPSPRSASVRRRSAGRRRRSTPWISSGGSASRPICASRWCSSPPVAT
jgi:lysophospholipase